MGSCKQVLDASVNTGNGARAIIQQHQRSHDDNEEALCCLCIQMMVEILLRAANGSQSQRILLEEVQSAETQRSNATDGP